MQNKRPSPPLACYLLWVLLTFTGVSALFGGIGLITEPNGNQMQITVSMLQGSPFTSYLIPGLILFVILGIFPLFLIYPQIARPEWKWANIFNIYADMYWAWTYCLYNGLSLVIWITFQTWLIGYHLLQTIYAFAGLLVIITTLLPQVKKHYSLTE